MIESTKILSATEFAPAGWQVRRLTSAEHAGSDLFERLRLKLCSTAAARMMVCFTDFSLWFSLPLSIWLTTGWIGLIFHWQAISKMACQVENASREAKPQVFSNVSAAESTRQPHQKQGQSSSRILPVRRAYTPAATGLR